MPEQVLVATVDRLEDDQAVLRFDDGQELVVPVALLPDGTGEGARVTLSFVGNAADESGRAAHARDVLNEILQGK